MKTWEMAALALFAAGSACAGWLARESADRTGCAYTAAGYGRLNGDLHSLARFALENVTDDVVGGIEKCWAAHPYGGPKHSIELVDARKAPSGGYYLMFEPLGISDVQLVFRVQRDRRVTQAFQYSTL